MRRGAVLGPGGAPGNVCRVEDASPATPAGSRVLPGGGTPRGSRPPAFDLYLQGLKTLGSGSGRPWPSRS